MTSVARTAFFTALVCTQCGKVFGPRERVVTCSECGSLLDVRVDLQQVGRGLSRGALAQRGHSIWRYRELLPVQRADNAVTLGEGWTPLVKAGAYAARLGLRNLYLKLDYLNPTGSFKDRGSAVLVSKAKELGVESVIDDSSGNAGSSIAAYCAAAGMTCSIYVPAGVPLGKTVQMSMYGASIVRVNGPRERVVQAARRVSEEQDAYYVQHGANAFFLEGNKTVAYEIAEQLNWLVPDHVVLPVGGGTLFVAAWRGFRELVGLGLTERTPRLHGVQSSACMPIVEAYERGLGDVEPVREGDTVAGGVRIGNPARGRQVLDAIRSSGGSALAVSDEELLCHQRALAEMNGIFAEPTSCAPLAGLSKLYARGDITACDTVVVSLTGFGLKDVETASKQTAP
jgi:threonine synthase